MLHAQTRRRVDVRHRAVTARVMWRAFTPTTGACPAVHTKTGCHQKVSTSVRQRSTYFPPRDLYVLWCSGIGMFPVVTVVSGSFCVQCTCCRDWTPLIFQHRNGGKEGSARSQLHFSCDLLHVALVLLADCSPNVPWWWGGKYSRASVVSSSFFFYPEPISNLSLSHNSL